MTVAAGQGESLSSSTAQKPAKQKDALHSHDNKIAKSERDNLLPEGDGDSGIAAI